MNQRGKRESILDEAKSPIDDILYGDGGSSGETRKEVQVRGNGLELSRNDYRRRYIARHYNANAPIGAPEKNENLPLLNTIVTATAREQYKSQKPKQENELATPSKGLEITVAIPSSEPTKSKFPEMETAKPKPPPVQEEVKEEPTAKVDPPAEANSSAKKSETSLTKGLHELGLNSMALKPLLLLYFKRS